MVQPTTNYHRFYASFRKLPKGGSDDDTKEALVSQYTGGRTTHLHEMQAKEYTALCQAVEGMLGYSDQRKRQRSICLRLMQDLGINTRDWQRINDFCRNPRISGKVFAQLTIEDLKALAKKLRAIQRNGGLRSEEGRVKSEESFESEEGRVKSEEFSCSSSNNKTIMIFSYGTTNQPKTC